MSDRLIRTALALPLLAIAFGMILGVGGLVGIGDDEGNMTRAGILISLAALPGLVVGCASRLYRLQQWQLEEAHTAGYRLALEHVAMGLLDPPPSTPTGGGTATTLPLPTRYRRDHQGQAA